jgi:CheY-like chemotaxis protein
VPYTLLLADDSVTIQRVIELTFADEDVQVVAVSDGDQAIERLESSPPDIVLADVGMPGRNGYEVSRYVKQTPKLAHIPVVLLTGAFEPVDALKAAEVGCDGVLAKPFEPQLVIGRVKELLANPARQVPQSPDAHTSAPVAEQMAPLAPDAVPAAAVEPAPEKGSLDNYFDRLEVAFTNLSAHPQASEAALPVADAADNAAAAPAVRQVPPVPSTPSVPDQIDWLTLPKSAIPALDLPLSYSTPPAIDESAEQPFVLHQRLTTREEGPHVTEPPPVPLHRPLPGHSPETVAAETQMHAAGTPQPEPFAPVAAAGMPGSAAAVADLTGASGDLTAAPAHLIAAPGDLTAAPGDPTAAPAHRTVAPTPAAPAPVALPTMAEAFAAFLAAEQNDARPGAAPAWPTIAPAAAEITDDVIEQVSRRVLDRLSDRVVRETVTDLVTTLAERLVREEIERIKATIK